MVTPVAVRTAAFGDAVGSAGGAIATADTHALILAADHLHWL